MFNKIKKISSILQEIKKLKKVEIKFCKYTEDTRKKYKETYEYFTKLHRLKLFRNKTLGVALIDLNLYKNFDEYSDAIKGKNYALRYVKKAIKKGYLFIEIDRNDYIDDIYEINTSTEQRQGKPMGEGYLQKVNSYKNEANYRYFGVVNSENRLVAYCNIAFYGEFALIVTLLGHKNYLNDGIMYLMMVEFNKIMFEEYKQKGYKYIMYDTFFGASEGLKRFKKRLKYQPYKVKWQWEN